MVDHVQTITIGGFLNNRQQFYSFPGGQVFNSDSLSEFAGEFNISIPFKHFKTGALVSYTLQEIYSWKPTQQDRNTPLEFIFEGSDQRIFQWHWDSDQALYEDVTKYF